MSLSLELNELDKFMRDLEKDGDLRAAARTIAPTRSAFLRFALAHGYSIRDSDILHDDELLDPDWVDVEQADCTPHNTCSTSTQK